MSQLNDNLTEILRQKNAYLLPQNIKKDVTVLGVTGTYEGSSDTKPYIELEYIESTGTQYIDTGVNASNGIDITVDFEFTKKGSTYYNVVFGTQQSSAPWQPCFVRYNTLNDYLESNRNDNENFTTNVDMNTRYIIRVRDTLNNKYVYINDENVDTSALSHSVSSATLYLMGSNNGGAQQTSNLKMYSTKIIDVTYDNLVRNLIPVKRKSDNEVCLYDKVTETFFTNQGIGSFIAGPVKDTSLDATMNIFVQTTEPTTKKGIWLQTNKTMEHVTFEDDIVESETWYPDNTYNDIPFNFIRGGDAFNIDTDIYIIAGYQSGEQRKIYKFNTVNNSYTRLTDVSVGINGSVIANVGTDIYIIGGDNITNSIYKYNINNQTTTLILNNFPNGIKNGAGIAIGTDIYIFGNDINTYTSYMNLAYKFNTLTNELTRLRDIPYNFGSSALVNIGDYIYLCGTITSTYDTAPRKYMYRYNIINNNYERLRDIPYYFDIGDAINFGSYIYLFGGYGYGDDTPQSKYVYKYNTLTDTYTKLQDMLYYFRSGSAVKVDNKVFILGGYSYPNKVQCLQLNTEDIDTDNTVVVNQGLLYNVGYKTELFTNNICTNNAKYSFADAWFYTTNDGLITDIPTYYGNGTTWVNFKNPPSQNQEEEVEE